MIRGRCGEKVKRRNGEKGKRGKGETMNADFTDFLPGRKTEDRGVVPTPYPNC
jgi:hypothetical protein